MASGQRSLDVHFLPGLLAPGSLPGSVAVVIDVLRSTTSMIQALAAGAESIRPCLEIGEARDLAGQLGAQQVVLAGERGARPIDGFDVGNSPAEFTAKRCKGKTIVMTTSNGTRAIRHAMSADRVLLAAFLNLSAVCDELRRESRSIQLICSGTEGEVSLEDALLAGAVVDYLCDTVEISLSDAARLAWDCYENHGRALQGALEVGKGGAKLLESGYHNDIRFACQVDLFNLVPELYRDPLRIGIGSVGVLRPHRSR